MKSYESACLLGSKQSHDIQRSCTTAVQTDVGVD